MAALASFRLTWTYTPGVGLASDKLAATLYNSTKKQFAVFPPSTARSTLIRDLDIAAKNWDTADDIHAYVSFKRLDGLDVSNSQHLLIEGA